MLTQATHAIVRSPSPSLERCELTHITRQPIDLKRAIAQHKLYCASLESAGLELIHAPPLANLPDSVFVEDTAIILPELAVVCSMGAKSRMAEPAETANLIRPWRSIEIIDHLSPIEGGDVLVHGKTIFVGRSTRTSSQAINLLDELVKPYGYRIREVPTTGALHLKTAFCAFAPDHFLVNRSWVDTRELADLHLVDVPADEPWGANVVTVNDRVLLPSAHPQTAETIERHGCQNQLVDISEFAKAGGWRDLPESIVSRTPNCGRVTKYGFAHPNVVDRDSLRVRSGAKSMCNVCVPWPVAEFRPRCRRLAQPNCEPARSR